MAAASATVLAEVRTEHGAEAPSKKAAVSGVATAAASEDSASTAAEGAAATASGPTRRADTHPLSRVPQSPWPVPGVDVGGDVDVGGGRS